MKHGTFAGGISLLMTFCVLCLSIFAALAMSTAMREQRFSEQYNKSAVNYYQADAEAVRIFEQILDGEPVDVDYTIDGDIFRFSVPVSDTQSLNVEVRASLDTKEILSWKTAFSAAWETNDYIEIWDGT